MRDFMTALALVLVIEGLLYAVLPDFMRRAMTAVVHMPPSALRRAGLIAAAVGVAGVWMIRGGW